MENTKWWYTERKKKHETRKLNKTKQKCLVCWTYNLLHYNVCIYQKLSTMSSKDKLVYNCCCFSFLISEIIPLVGNRLIPNTPDEIKVTAFYQTFSKVRFYSAIKLQRLEIQPAFFSRRPYRYYVTQLWHFNTPPSYVTKLQN